jgi:hypothetical protein
MLFLSPAAGVFRLKVSVVLAPARMAILSKRWRQMTPSRVPCSIVSLCLATTLLSGCKKDSSPAAPTPTQPVLTSVTPNVGSTLGRWRVTIAGSRFVSGATVTLGGTAATSVTFTSANSITATTPARAAGAVDVVVTNPDGQSSTLANGYTFAVMNYQGNWSGSFMAFVVNAANAVTSITPGGSGCPTIPLSPPATFTGDSFTIMVASPFVLMTAEFSSATTAGGSIYSTAPAPCSFSPGSGWSASRQ